MKLPTEIVRMMVDLQNENEERAAAADPVKHRLSRLMRGGKLRYVYFNAGKDGRGSRVRFCYSTARNVAGYFLIWREVETGKKVARDQWDATTSKKSAIRTAEQLRDDFKARHVQC